MNIAPKYFCVIFYFWLHYFSLDCYQTNYQLKFEDRSCSSVLNPTMTRLLAESETDNITQNQYCTTHLNDSLPSSRLKKTDSFRDDVMSSWSFPQYEDEVFTDTELPFGFWDIYR